MMLNEQQTNDSVKGANKLQIFILSCIRQPLISASVIVFTAVVVISIAAPWIAPYDPDQQILIDRLQLPSSEYLLGTDHLGRDVLSRLMYAGRFSLTVTVVAVIVSAVRGTVLGANSGRVGGLTDEIIMRTVDLMLAFPSEILALLIASLINPGATTIILSVLLTGWTTFARLARATALDVSGKEFVLAATSIGTRESLIVFRHILPNILPSIMALLFVRFGHLMLGIAGLSYLGLGAQPPTADWGLMLADAQPYMQRVPSLVLAPSLVIFVTALSVTIVGQAISSWLDPKL
ncbi:MAG: ABC transporter permease [Chloroflexota bacterium]